jgi:hypothetical protein
MPVVDSLLFAGTTTRPARSFLASCFEPEIHTRVVMPCVGSWAGAMAVAGRVGPDRIDASDLSLHSSLIGYLADRERTVEELGVIVPPGYDKLVEGTRDEAEWAAGVMLATKLLGMIPSNAHVKAARDELWANHRKHREHVADRLRQVVERMAGCRYRIADVREVVDEVAEEGDEATGFYVNPPGYGSSTGVGGYTKMYGHAEEVLWAGGTKLGVLELRSGDVRGLLSNLSDRPARALAYIHHGSKQAPEGWVRLAAFAGKRGRVDYIIGNHELEGRRVVSRFDRPPALWPVFTDDHEITPQTEVRFVLVDKHTCLHYRDLFVHRLGITEGELYGLMLLDGRVTTAFGLFLRDLVRGAKPYLYETFGITVTSARYARLGKLFMLCLTSRDFQRWMMGQRHIPEPRGLQTSSPTVRHEGKTDRSVMKLIKREPRPGGGFQLVYQADWRDETWSESLQRWLEQWGGISRPGWTVRRLTGEQAG